MYFCYGCYIVMLAFWLRRSGALGRGRVGPRGLLPYRGYIGMCRPKGYGFSGVLAINRVSILANYGHFGHK